MSASNNILVYAGEEPERLDKVLVQQNPDYTRARIQRFIDDGCVTINGIPARKTGQKVEAGDAIGLSIPEPVQSDLIPENIQLDIIFEDEHVLVVNKPAGMVVHPSVGHDSGTLVHAALGHEPDMAGIAGEGRPGIVHRLDKDTSGIILLAKDEKTLNVLQEQFKNRSIEKIYLALVDRRPPTPFGKIEAAIGRDPSHRQRMAILTEEKGRPAVSEYKTLQTFKDHTLLEVHPLTGRTHQIRLHLALIGCPIAGDTIYGFRKSSIGIHRHFLHATRLKVLLPGEKTPRLFEAPLPPELQVVLANLSAQR
jgi:23S rRNA pseudouridine1911/1915/1917 synthase